KRAAADGMPALALTDSANLFGMVKFYGAARAAGVKPIVGADCWVQNEADRDKPHRVLLLCASRAGYRRLCELLSRAWLRNQHRATVVALGRAGDARRLAGGGDPSGAVPRARGLQGARGARLHRAGLRARRSAPAEAVHRGAVLQAPC